MNPEIPSNPPLLPSLPDRRSSTPGGHWVFILLFCLSLAFLVSNALAPSIRSLFPDRERNKFTPGETFEWIIQAKFLIAFNDLQKPSEATAKAEIGLPASPLAKAAPLNSLNALLKDKTNPYALRRALALAGRLGWKDQTREIAQLLRKSGASPETTPDQRRINEALLHLYGQSPRQPLSEAELRLIEERFGWFARVVKCDHWLLADPPKGRQAESALRMECRRMLVTMLSAFVAGAGVFVTGGVLLILFLIQAGARKMRWRGVERTAPEALECEMGASALHGASLELVPARGFQPWQAFEAFALYLFLMAAAAVVFGALHLPKGGIVRLTGLLWTVLALGVIFWPLARGARLGDIRRFLGLSRGAGTGAEAMAGAAGYAAIFPAMISVTIVAALIASRFGLSASAGAHPLAPLLMDNPSWTQRITLAILAVAVAPLTEEIMFRGLFYGWLRSVMRAPAAVILCGLLFAALHPQGILGLPVLFVLGAGFSILREWRGSLIAPMIAHALVNGGTTVVLMLL